MSFSSNATAGLEACALTEFLNPVTRSNSQTPIRLRGTGVKEFDLCQSQTHDGSLG